MGTLTGAQMKIQVNRIPPEGLHEDVAYDPAELDIARFDIQPERVALSAVIMKAATDVIVDATIRGELTLTCGRCLEPFHEPLQTRALLNYEVQPTDVLDITEDIRQEVLLAYPMVPVCQPECRGLCKICGQNLNTASCAHQLATT